MVQVKHIGLVNLVAGEGIAPELIQKDVNPRRIAKEGLRILRDSVLQQKMVESLKGVRQRLGNPGAAQRAARIVMSLLQGEN
jgi:lipid-A-disaccharide synthase